MEYCPAATLLQVRVKGGELLIPRLLLPSKNSTPAMVPSISVALALKVTLAGAVATKPLAGDRRLRAGGLFVSFSTNCGLLAAASFVLILMKGVDVAGL